MSSALYFRRSRLIWFAVVLASVGCGVSDYEAKMQKAEERVQQIDNENKLLGDPLDIPIRPDTPTIPIFLRPPIGVGTVSVTGEFPYHYTTDKGVCTDVYIAVAENSKGVEKLIEEQFGLPLQNWQAVAGNFEAVEFVDTRASATPSSCQAYVRDSVGVVFRFPTANRDAALSSIQMSLKTFAEGSDAGKARAAFNKRTHH